MTKRVMALLCVCALMLSCSAYASSYDYGFTDFMTDEWTNTSEATDALAAGKIGVQSYAAEKMAYVAKTADTDTTVSATKTFDELSGTTEMWLAYSMTGEGNSYLEFLNANDEVVLKFAASKDAFSYVDAMGNESPLATGLEENTRYNLKFSNSFPATSVMVTFGSRSAQSAPLMVFPSSINKVRISTADYGNSMSLYHFSVDSSAVFCWDDMQEADDIASWSFSKGPGDTAEIRNSGESGFLNYYRGEAGHHTQMKWKVGDSSRALGFKMTMKYSFRGAGNIQPRLLRQDGGQFFTQLKISENSVGYATNPTDTSQFTTNITGLEPNKIHTLTIYSDKAAETYDLYVDGVLAGQGIPQLTAGDVGVGGMIFYSHLGQTEKFAMRIYSLKIEENYERKAMNVSEGVFRDAYGNELQDIQAGVITGEYTISSDGLGDPEGMVMMMQYEGDKLVKISATPVSALVNENLPVSGEIEISEVTENTKLYMCLWDGLDTIVPMTDTMSILD